MKDDHSRGMSPASALRLEYTIIGLGVVAMVLIFQPFSITLFAVGSALVVLAGLVNNVLPMARSGVRPRAVVQVALIVALIFCIVLLVSIGAAHLYGVAFLAPPNPDTASGKAQLATPPFWRQPLVWGIAVAAAVFAVLIAALSKGGK